MVDTNATDQERDANVGAILGMCAISCSTLILEIALTKFLSYKLYHHMTFAVLSVVILSFGAAGTISYLNPKFLKLLKPDCWAKAGVYAVFYAISTMIVVPLFCALPINSVEYSQSPILGVMTLPAVFMLLSVPFVFGGICISQTLTYSKYPVPMIYCADLMAAALGASLCPILLPLLGGFGTVAFAGILGLAGAIGYWCCSQHKSIGSQIRLSVLVVLAFVFCIQFPAWLRSATGMDIPSAKDLGVIVAIKDFGGFQHTHWNAIARVDISKTGTSKSPVFRYGLSPDTDNEEIQGRFVLLDGGANTRQFLLKNQIADNKFLGTALWASPYVAKPDCRKALVIGGGGGIDILVGKFMKIPNLTVVELNPAVFRMLTGQADNEQKLYAESLSTDDTTKVEVLNEEGRHFASTQAPHTYDVIQASGVDTLTAIQTGGMSLVENYLYTVEAVRNYMKILRPGGILSLTHWRTEEPRTSMRMFTTYLAYLDSIGVKEPWKHIVVLGGNGGAQWSDSMLKTDEFSPQELERIRKWAEVAGISVIFDPERKAVNSQPKQSESLYYKLGFAPAQERQKLLAEHPEWPGPVYDDKPYFYAFNQHVGDFWAIANDSTTPIYLMAAIVVCGLGLALLPLIKLRKHEISGPVIWSALYFGLAGFAFLLYETAIIQSFNNFVGGPTYSLAAVLVAVLAGYSLGSLMAMKMNADRFSFTKGGVALTLLFILLYWSLPILTDSLLPLALPARLLVAILVTGGSSFAVGVVVSSAMSLVRKRFGSVVAWMWGISSTANAIGSISFVAITQATGISRCFIVVAVAYLLANILFAKLVQSRVSE